MRGCRHSGVRVIVPPRSAPSPTRITCRYVRPQRTPHPPPLMEGEALASRVLELGPVGAKFLGPVIIEVPHFAALRGKEREIVILRSDNGESWKEHTVEASEEILNEVLHDSFDAEDLNQLEDISSGRITRILTQDFPQYFAVVSRVRQEVHAIGPEGGMVSSTVVPQVQAVFPEGALTKKIKVGLQAQPIDPELTAKLLGHSVAVSPVVTVEPRRRKFHKAITLSMPAPRAHSQGMINQYSGSAPTLRLLCSITGGTTRAQWEDVTGSTPLTFVNDCVSFTTTVSARFWLMDCRNIGDATKMATELYKEAIHVPFMAKFVVFAKRVDPLEARLRVFCMTDDKEDKTLEHQEHFTEVAKSRDVEVLEGKQQYVEFAGNLVPITKSGEQLSFSFRAFRENRLPFSVRVKDQHAEAVSRCLFMKEPKVPKGEPPQQPICILNIVLPDDIVTDTISLTDTDSLRKYTFLSENFDYYRPDPRLADMSNLLGEDWVPLANQLGLTTSEINVIKSEYPDSVAKQAQSMLRMWLSQSGNKSQTNTLENALRRIGREDIIPQCLNVDHAGPTITRIKHEEIGKYRLKKDIDSIDNDAVRDEVGQRVRGDRQEAKTKLEFFDKYSAEEKEFDKSEEEEEPFDKPVAERREQIQKRLSAERTIPASSQRREIVQEITTIKEQNLVEDKIAEVLQKVKTTEDQTKTTTTKTFSIDDETVTPDTKTVSRTIEIKTTIPSDSKVLGTISTEKQEIKSTALKETHISEVSHKTAGDSELLEGVTQSFDKKKVIPNLIADEDPKSPKFSKTPPPSPADFIIREQEATIQEWEAARQPLDLEPKAPSLEKDATDKGKTTVFHSEDKPFYRNITDRSFVNRKPIYDLTNALIQSESRAEPYHIHTEKHYSVEKYENEKESQLFPTKDKRRKKGLFGTIKNFVGKSFESDSDSEKSPKKERTKDKKKTKASVDEPAPEIPVRPTRKPKLPTPTEDRRYADIPFFESSPSDLLEYRSTESDDIEELSFSSNQESFISSITIPIRDHDDHYSHMHRDVKDQTKGVVTDVSSGGEKATQGKPTGKTVTKTKKQKVVIVDEEVTKTFTPIAVDEEEFTIIIDPTKKESPKKTRETFTLNIDESIGKIEKEILGKCPILPEENLMKPIAQFEENPIRPPNYGDFNEPPVSSQPDNLFSQPEKWQISTDVKTITNNSSRNEMTHDQHDVGNNAKLQPGRDKMTKIVGEEKNYQSNLKTEKKIDKLFGIYNSPIESIDESVDESRKEIMEKQNNEISKEITHISNVDELADSTTVMEKAKKVIKSPKSKKNRSEEMEERSLLGFFKKGKSEVKPTFSETAIRNMIDSTSFLREEVDRYNDVQYGNGDAKFHNETKVTQYDSHPEMAIVKSSQSGQKIARDRSPPGKIEQVTKPEIVLASRAPHHSKYTIGNIKDCNSFLKEEVEKYHDVHTYINKPQQIAREENTYIDKNESTLISDGVETPSSTPAKIESEETQMKLMPFGSSLGTPFSGITQKNFASSYNSLRDEANEYHDVHVAIENQQSMKKIVVESPRNDQKDVSIEVKLVVVAPDLISEMTRNEMKDCTNLLKNEVETYHDVRSIIRDRQPVVKDVVSPREKEKGRSPKDSKVKGRKKFAFFDTFKKGSGEEEVNPGEVEAPVQYTLSQTTRENMKICGNFLKCEIDNYHDVHPDTIDRQPVVQEVVSTQEIQNEISPKKSKTKDEKKSTLFGKFKRSSEERDVRSEVVLAPTQTFFTEETQKNMKESSDFLKDEVDKYHDVRPTMKIHHPVVQVIDSFSEIENECSSKKEISEDKKKRSFFDKFMKGSEEKKLKSERAVAPVQCTLTETTRENMKDCDNFLKEEVDKYHDVRPVTIDVQTVVQEVHLSEKIEKNNSSKKSKTKDGQKFTFFDKFKKSSAKPKVESEGVVVSVQCILSESTRGNMKDCDNFLKDEVDKYHDVRPVIVDRQLVIEEVFSSEEIETESSPWVSKTKDGKKIAFLDKNKKGSAEQKVKSEGVVDPDQCFLSEITREDMKDCSNFLKDEVNKYHDVRPVMIDRQPVVQEVILSEEIEKDGSSKKSRTKGKKKFTFFDKFKKGSEKREVESEGVVAPVQCVLSEKTQENMKDCGNFLKDGIDKYHDVRLVAIDRQPVEQEVLSSEEVKIDNSSKKSETKDGIFFTLLDKFKKSSEEREVKSEEVVAPVQYTLSEKTRENMKYCDIFLKEEVDKYHDARLVTIDRQTFFQEVNSSYEIEKEVSSKKLKMKDGEKFLFFEKFKKGPEEREVNSEGVVAPLPCLTRKIMKDCDHFLEDEVEKYHDVRSVTIDRQPVEQEVLLSEKIEKDSSPKKPKMKDGKKFTLFDEFKKSSVEREVKSERVVSSVQCTLGETTRENMEDCKNFLRDELDKYHDVRPIIIDQQPVMHEVVSKHLGDAQETDIERSAHRNIFDDIGSESSKRTVTTTVTKESIPKGERVTKVSTEVITGTIQLDAETLRDVSKLEKIINSELEQIREQLPQLTKSVDIETPTECKEKSTTETRYGATEGHEEISKLHPETKANITDSVPSHKERITITEKHFVKEGGYLNETFAVGEVGDIGEVQNRKLRGDVIRLNESDNISMSEINKYENDNDRLLKNRSEKSKSREIQPKLSVETLANMITTSNFLREEVSKYHDVKYIVSNIEPEFKCKEKGVKFFGLFSKKKSSDKDNQTEHKKHGKKTKKDKSVEKVKDRSIKETDSKDFSRKEIDRCQEGEINKDESKQENGSFFGLFSRKTKLQGKGNGTGKTSVLSLSQEALKKIKESSEFLQMEINDYQDFRPTFMTLSTDSTGSETNSLLLNTQSVIVSQTPIEKSNDNVIPLQISSTEYLTKTVISSVPEESIPGAERVSKVIAETMTGTIQLDSSVKADLSKLEDINEKLNQIRAAESTDNLRNIHEDVRDCGRIQTVNSQSLVDPTSGIFGIHELKISSERNDRHRLQQIDPLSFCSSDKKQSSQIPDTQLFGKISNLQPSIGITEITVPEETEAIDTSESFPKSELEQYDDGRVEIVSDLDSDYKTEKASGLFGIFSKKERSESPKVHKKMSEKLKGDTHSAVSEKMSVIEKIGGKIPSFAASGKKGIFKVNQQDSKCTDGWDKGIGGTFKEKSFSFDETISKTQTFSGIPIIMEYGKQQRSSDRAQVDVGKVRIQSADFATTKQKYFDDDRDSLKTSNEDTMEAFELRTENIKKGVADISKMGSDVAHGTKQISECNTKKVASFEETIDEKFSDTIKLTEEFSKKSKQIFETTVSSPQCFIENERRFNTGDTAIDDTKTVRGESIRDHFPSISSIHESKKNSSTVPVPTGGIETGEQVELGIASTIQNVEDAAEENRIIANASRIYRTANIIVERSNHEETTMGEVNMSVIEGLKNQTMKSDQSDQQIIYETNSKHDRVVGEFDDMNASINQYIENIPEESMEESRKFLEKFGRKKGNREFRRIFEDQAYGIDESVSTSAGSIKDDFKRMRDEPSLQKSSPNRNKYSDMKQHTQDFLIRENVENDGTRMPREVSDYGVQVKRIEKDFTTKISEANIDLFNLPTKTNKLCEQPHELSTYVTSPTSTRRTKSSRYAKGEGPEVVEITYDTTLDSSSDDSYIVTEPDENIIQTPTKSRIFHIESEEDSSSEIHEVTNERQDSTKSNILEVLTENKLECLLTDLTENFGKIDDRIKTNHPKQEKRLEEHKKESQADVELIEKKLRDLDEALDSLEKVNLEIQIDTKSDSTKGTKLRRVERKFEKMASDAMEKEVEEGKDVQMTSPEIEEKRETDFRTLVSQLSTEELSDFQRDYNHLWDETTFSKSSDWESKTPDSQTDAQELPQGSGETTSEAATSKESATSIVKSEGEEGTEKDEAGYDSKVADQHQLSEEMKALLKELERESKQ